jgi:hypothetical protein
MSAANQSAAALLNDLERAGFWGSLEIKLEAGNVVLIKKTETLKPNQRSNWGNENGNC